MMRPVSRRSVIASVASASLARAAEDVPTSSEEELKATLAAQRSSFEQIRKVELPMSVEPAAVFRP